MNFQLTEKPIVEVRNGEVLVIFPSRPYWFAATEEIQEVIVCLDDCIEKDVLVKIVSQRLGLSLDDAQETVDEIQELLFSSGVLFVDGMLCSTSNEITPHFQLEAVENVLVIATTQGCNLNCYHCYADARKRMKNEMSTEEIRSLIDDLAKMPWKNNISRVGLTGGEFFTRPDAIEIIDYVHRSGFRVLISSNGLMISDKIVSQLAKYPNLKVSISLDGPSADIHEIVRGPCTFDRTVEVMSNMSQQGIFVGANMFVHQDNMEYIEATLAVAQDLGARAFNCLNMMMVGRANSRKSKKKFVRVPEYVLYRQLFSILRKNLGFQQMMVNSTFANQIMGINGGVKSHYCGIGTNRALYVKADGSIYPCPDTALPRFLLGNIRTQELRDIWQNSPILAELRQIDVDSMNSQCASCDVRYQCGGGCRGENYQVTGEILSPHFNCKEIRKTILEMMWMLTEEPTLFQSKVVDLHTKVDL